MARAIRVLVIAIMLASAGVLAACGDDDAHERGSGEVVLYTSLPDPVVDRLRGVIEERFPDMEGRFWVPLSGEGITLRVVRGRTADIERLIAEEIENGGVQADVLWLAEPSPYETYKEMGLLAPYDPPSDAPIPPLYVDPDGFYVAGRVIAMVLAWNTDLRQQGLTDWPDLQTVATKAFPAPESGAARATIQALLDRYGNSYFTTLERSGGVSVPSNGAARDGLTARRYEAVAVLDYMVREAMADGLPVDYAYPATGTVLIPSPIAITATAPNPDAARAFVDFLLSQSGQEIVVQIGSFFPVRDDVEPPEGAPSLDEITAFEVDWKGLAEDAEAINRFWETCFAKPIDPT